MDCTVYESDDDPALSGNCDVDVDECLSAPCLHGVCFDSNTDPRTPMPPNAYRCSCADGFESAGGGNCDVDVDECASDPCMHGATCMHSGTDSKVPIYTYQCTCKPGYVAGALQMISKRRKQPYQLVLRVRSTTNVTAGLSFNVLFA